MLMKILHDISIPSNFHSKLDQLYLVMLQEVQISNILIGILGKIKLPRSWC